MWISKAHYNTLDGLVNSSQARNTEMLGREGALRQRVIDLEAENQRQRNDIKWFMHRLNQVELERAQLINAAIGVKLHVPQFQPPVEHDAADVLNSMGAPYAGVGEDSPDPADQIPAHEDFSHLPGYKG
jgi:hypothetical protein